MRALFRLDACRSLGLGHLARCITLAEEMRRRFSCEITFALATAGDFSLAGSVPSWVKTVGYPVDPAGPRWDFVFTDVPGIRLGELQLLRPLAKVLVRIEDEESEAESCSDILISPNLKEVCRQPQANARYLHGAEYVIVRREFAPYRQQRRETSRIASRILVCMGGSDPRNLTARVVSTLRSSRYSWSVLVITGAAYRESERLDTLIGNDSRLRWIRNAPNMAELLWHSDLAIIGGGTLMYESCVLGTPAVTICQNRDQDIEASLFDRAGAVVNCGEYSPATDEVLPGCFESLALDWSRREQLSVAGRLLVDGRGAERIVTNALECYASKGDSQGV